LAVSSLRHLHQAIPPATSDEKVLPAKVPPLGAFGNFFVFQELNIRETLSVLRIKQ
jgi:hypothetical protein